MGIHKQLKIDHKAIGVAAVPISPWLWRFPNTADQNFNYYHLLDIARDTGIGSNVNPDFRIAVIGCGVAGLTAARELFRSGYANIDLYEATDRLGGRTFSVPATGQQTCFELGAMRLPFFNTTDELPGFNSALAWYTKEYGIAYQPFPDPGSDVANTGIYLNDGFGPVNVPRPGQKPELLLWITQGINPPPPPPTEALQAIYNIWNAFATMFTAAVKPVYGTPAWTDLWHTIVSNYWEINFRDFAYLPRIETYDPADPGNFGGLGLTQEQAQLLYTIGVGDGSWGAFYDISVLYIFRTMLFGYGNDHQLILGKLQGGPEQNAQLTDSAGNTFIGPSYLGVNSYADCMFFEPVRSTHVSGSLFDAMRTGNVKLFTSTLVNSIDKTPEGIVLTTKSGRTEPPYDAVIMSPPTWAMQINTPMNGFDVTTEWPFVVQTSFAMSHWIRSCKVMYALKERFWEVSKIPQLLSTDIQLQGVYAYAAGDTDPGVLLVSYTWEDDANKFLAQGFEPTLGSSLLELLDSILLRCTNIQQKISPFVDTSEPPVIMQWSLMPTYLACAKLYHERSWDLDYALLRYNQNFSVRSGIYFAGEGFSVEGGWTEPALRGALDAVVHLINNTGGTFVSGFDFAADYPRYSEWSPYRGSSDKLRRTLMNIR